MNTFSKKLKPLILVFTLCIQSSALLANSKLDKFECPRTLPSSDKSIWYDNRYAHHNDVLAVHLYDSGSRSIGQSGAWRQDDGYIHSKYPWIKKVAGKLKVQGQRLDGKSDRQRTPRRCTRRVSISRSRLLGNKRFFSGSDAYLYYRNH